MHEEADKFIERLETENNGKIVYKTFAVLLGKSRETVRNIGGLLYIINRDIYFEDFEKQTSFLQVFGKKTIYKKYKINFRINEISCIKEVTEKCARSSISGFKSHTSTKETSGFIKYISKKICQIQFGENYSLFFEILDLKGFIKFIKNQPDFTG